MASNETSVISSESKVKELHGNVRHVTQLAMNWFAFFVTVNYVTLGWFAKGPGEGSINPRIVSIVADVFIVQNFLGIFGLAGVLIATSSMRRQIIRLENPLADEGVSTTGIGRKLLALFKRLISWRSVRESTPTFLYNLIGLFLMIVLISLIYAWRSIPSISQITITPS